MAMVLLVKNCKEGRAGQTINTREGNAKALIAANLAVPKPIRPEVRKLVETVLRIEPEPEQHTVEVELLDDSEDEEVS